MSSLGQLFLFQNFNLIVYNSIKTLLLYDNYSQYYFWSKKQLMKLEFMPFIRKKKQYLIDEIVGLSKINEI